MTTSMLESNESCAHKLWLELGETEGYSCPWCEIDRMQRELTAMKTSYDAAYQGAQDWMQRALKAEHVLADYRRQNAEHERLIGKLYELLPDNPDDAYDLVRAEYLSIHGPSDD